MSDALPETPSVESRPTAWLPLAPQGVAAFALASFSRLLTVTLVGGLVSGAVVAWFVNSAWFPVVGQAGRNLPAAGSRIAARLEWTGPSPMVLAANRYLALVVDLEHSGKAGQTADLQLELTRQEIFVSGLLGGVALRYPETIELSLDQREFIPWWGAWRQALITGIVISAGLGLLVVWFLLGLLYAPAAKLISFLFSRPLPWRAAWKMAVASLMPGALVMNAAIALYAWGWIDLVRLGFFAVFHLPIAWIYLGVSPLCLPRPAATERVKENPFASATDKNPGRKGRNPFASEE